MSRFPAYPRHSRSAERGRGQEAVWGKEGILPPASVSSSQWFARVFSALLLLSFPRALWLRLVCLRSPPSHNPLPRFHIGCMWCRFRFGFLYCKITAALIL